LALVLEDGVVSDDPLDTFLLQEINENMGAKNKNKVFMVGNMYCLIRKGL
jgi:hypothetical protein